MRRSAGRRLPRCDVRPFSWTEDRDDIVLPEQPETAVYINAYGFVVIRQNGWPDDEDAIVKIDPHNVPLLVAVMLETDKEAECGHLRLTSPQPRSETQPKSRSGQLHPPPPADLLEGVA